MCGDKDSFDNQDGYYFPPLELLKQFPVKMVGSGQRFEAYVFRIIKKKKDDGKDAPASTTKNRV